MRKKKPIVPVNEKQNFFSGRSVSDNLNKEMNNLAKKIRK